jgi:hypothetical protein
MELAAKFKIVSEGHSIIKPPGIEVDKAYSILEITEETLLDDLTMTQIKLRMDDEKENTFCLHPAYRTVVSYNDMSEINSHPGKFKLILKKKGDCGKCFVLDIVT